MAFWGRGVFQKYARYGNHFYYDYSAYTDAEIRRGFERVAENEAAWHPRGKYNRIDLAALADHIIRHGRHLDVGFGNEYSMGGIAVRDDFSTGVPGLYAAGEVTGGTFGAFRSGDGLVEMLAQGRRAGRSAADFAAHAGGGSPDNTEKILRTLLAPLQNHAGISPVDVLARLESIADSGFNFYRTGETLARAAKDIARLRASLERMGTADSRRVYNSEWYDAIVARNLTLCADIGIHAAADRRESRGCHMRLDYPAVDNRRYWHNTYARLRDGEIVYRRERPELLDTPLPDDRYPTVADYILKQFEGNAIENFSIKK